MFLFIGYFIEMCKVVLVISGVVNRFSSSKVLSSEKWLFIFSFVLWVFIVFELKISIGIISGSVSSDINILLLCSFSVSVVLIVFIKFSIGVLSSRVSSSMLVVEVERLNCNVNSGDISISSSIELY